MMNKGRHEFNMALQAFLTQTLINIYVNENRLNRTRRGVWPASAVRVETIYFKLNVAGLAFMVYAVAIATSCKYVPESSP